MTNRLLEKYYVIFSAIVIVSITTFFIASFVSGQKEELPNPETLTFDFADGMSMYPTIKDGDLLISEKATEENLIVGQIVIAYFDIYGDGVARKIVKRISMIDESGYFLVGDNEAFSLDSETFGYVQREDITQVVLYTATYVYAE